MTTVHMMLPGHELPDWAFNQQEVNGHRQPEPEGSEIWVGDGIVAGERTSRPSLTHFVGIDCGIHRSRRTRRKAWKPERPQAQVDELLLQVHPVARFDVRPQRRIDRFPPIRQFTQLVAVCQEGYQFLDSGRRPQADLFCR